MLVTKVFLVIFLSAFVNPAVVRDITAEEENYILPESYEVSDYTIDLTVAADVFTGQSTSFDGTVTVKFTLTKADNNIQIHAPMETIKSLELKAGDTPILTTTSLNEVTSILTITPTTETLTQNQQYTLTISYTGVLGTNGQGFFVKSYKDSQNADHYFVTTQFQPVYARQAFPCFDEPQYKAQFTISITYPTGYTALSNMPVSANPVTVDTNIEKVTFKPTPKMSTYLVAFTISDFTCSTDQPIETGIPHQVCSQIDAEKERSLAAKYGPTIMAQLGELTGIFYKDHNIGKMDQVAVPDFSGSMENYGLVLHRESSLLYSDTESSNINKQKTLIIIAHEFAHMWFGNIATLKWWDYTFLNEGFASLFEYLAVAQIAEIETTENWQMNKQFVAEEQQPAFVADSSLTSLALTSASSSPEQINGKFGTISYNKGASVFKMLYNIMGSADFLKGINTYLTTNDHGSVTPTELWTALKTITSLNALLPTDVSLDTVMDSWINKAGFPVVSVSANGDTVTLTQKRFLYEGEDETEWYVPITYTVSSQPENFATLTPPQWLIPSSSLELTDALKDNDWIFINNQASGYYRVHYDPNLLSKIKDAFSSDLTKIDVLNRAQFVDDVFNLAKAGIMKYSETLDAIKFLQNDTEYYPWVSAITGFNSLTKEFGSTSQIGKALTTLQLDLLQNVYKSVPITTLKPDDQIYTLKQMKVLDQMCKLGDESCQTSANDLFVKAKAGTSVDRNLKSLVYCNGLRYSATIEEDWTFLWNKFQSATVATEKNTILAALGCTKDATKLKTLLEQSINAESKISIQQFSSVWSSVINSNPEGVNVALDYFIENYKAITEYYSGSVSILSTFASTCTEQGQIDKLEGFSNTEGLEESLKTAAQIATTSAKSNLNWATTVKDDFEVYFDLKGAAPGNWANIFSIISMLFISIIFVY